MNYDLHQVKKEVESGQARLLDVREQEEWNDSHLQEAQLEPLSQLDAGREPEKLKKEDRAYTHCRAGQRSFMAADILKARGYINIIPLAESFEDLVNFGFVKA